MKRFFTNFFASLSLLLFFSAPAFSDNKAPPVHLMVLNPDWPADRLKDKNVEVLHAEDLPDSITAAERDAMLQDAKIEELTLGWSQLDKNLIFLRASYLTAAEMQAKYPDFTESQIASILEVAQKHDAGHRL